MSILHTRPERANRRTGTPPQLRIDARPKPVPASPRPADPAELVLYLAHLIRLTGAPADEGDYARAKEGITRRCQRPDGTFDPELRDEMLTVYRRAVGL